jgi:hypothetical protein
MRADQQVVVAAGGTHLEDHRSFIYLLYSIDLAPLEHFQFTKKRVDKVAVECHGFILLFQTIQYFNMKSAGLFTASDLMMNFSAGYGTLGDNYK